MVLCARLGTGIRAEDAGEIRDVLNGVGSNGWWFLHPGTFIAVFVSRYAGAEHAAECRAALEDLVAARPSLGNLEIGAAEGAVLGVFTDSAILETMPIGEVLARAMKRAMHAG